MKKIAEQAGTSVSTVSMVLRDYPVRCSAETAENIKRIARKYNYVPNYAAVSLVRQKTDSVGIIVPDIENAFFAGLVKQLSRLFGNDGYTLLLSCSEDRPKAEQIEMLRRKNVDALILALPFEEEGLAEAVGRLTVPHIAVDSYDARIKCGCVAADHARGAEMATEFLISNGHRKIGCITGGNRAYSAVRRYEGFVRSMHKNGLAVDEDRILCGDYTFVSGYENAKILLKKDVTAIFAFNDMMAFGAMKAAAEMGRKIPGDVSLVGYDDAMFSSMATVPLTTVRQPLEEISWQVYRKIRGLLRGEASEGEPSLCTVQPELIVRESVRDLLA